MDGQKVYKGGGTEDVSWRLRFHIGSDCEHGLLWILVSEVIKGDGSVVTYTMTRCSGLSGNRGLEVTHTRSVTSMMGRATGW